MSRCNHKFERGIALVQVFGRVDREGNRVLNIHDGQTIYPVGAKMMDCWKCQLCGHSEYLNISASGDQYK